LRNKENVKVGMSQILESPDVHSVAVAALLKLIKLLGAELVAGRHRDDIELFEKCVREKLYAHPHGVSAEATAAGVALAHSWIEPILRDLRIRVDQANEAPRVDEAKPAIQRPTLH